MKKKPKKATYGRVTVAESPKGVRVRWREDLKDRERTTPTFEDGCRLAQEINARLESGGVGSPEGSFAALVAAATARSEYLNYSDDAWRNIRSVVKYHIVPAFDHRKARSVTKSEPSVDLGRPSHQILNITCQYWEITPLLPQTWLRTTTALGPLADCVHGVDEDAGEHQQRHSSTEDEERLEAHPSPFREPAKMSAPRARMDGTQIPT